MSTPVTNLLASTHQLASRHTPKEALATSVCIAITDGQAVPTTKTASTSRHGHRARHHHIRALPYTGVARMGDLDPEIVLLDPPYQSHAGLRSLLKLLPARLADRPLSTISVFFLSNHDQDQLTHCSAVCGFVAGATAPGRRPGPLLAFGGAAGSSGSSVARYGKPSATVECQATIGALFRVAKAISCTNAFGYWVSSRTSPSRSALATTKSTSSLLKQSPSSVAAQTTAICSLSGHQLHVSRLVDISRTAMFRSWISAIAKPRR